MCWEIQRKICAVNFDVVAKTKRNCRQRWRHCCGMGAHIRIGGRFLSFAPSVVKTARRQWIVATAADDAFPFMPLPSPQPPGYSSDPHCSCAISHVCCSPVLLSNNELSLFDASRFSAGGGKRPRDRNALRVAVRVRPLIERETGSRTVACDGGDGQMVVVNPKKFKASADAVSAATARTRGPPQGRCCALPVVGSEFWGRRCILRYG